MGNQQKKNKIDNQVDVKAALPLLVADKKMLSKILEKKIGLRCFFFSGQIESPGLSTSTTSPL